MSTTTAQRWTRQPWTLRGVPAETFRGFRADRGFDLAGSLAFTSILTAVPLLASLSLFLVTFFRENDDQILYFYCHAETAVVGPLPASPACPVCGSREVAQAFSPLAPLRQPQGSHRRAA